MMGVIFKSFTLIVIFFISSLQANIVDVWEFNSEENEARAVELAKQLRCPQCQNQNLVESTSPIARDLRLEVYKMVDEGKSDIEILELMTERFGDFVLYNPKLNNQTLLLWIAPFVMLFFASFYFWRTVKGRRGDDAFSAEQYQKLRRLLQQNGSD